MTSCLPRPLTLIRLIKPRLLPAIFPPVNFPVIAYEFEAGCKFVESLAASAGNQKRSH